MQTKGVIILGSSRSNGNTYKIASYLQEKTGFELLDLKTKLISPFDYEHNNKDDEFMPLINDIVNNYEVLIFATPVYWYAMSGIMKIFFDRITDCIKFEKEIGRKFKSKRMGMLSCGSDEELKSGFTMPFEESARYLGMHYLGDVHTWMEEEKLPGQVKARIDQFASSLKIHSQPLATSQELKI